MTRTHQDTQGYFCKRTDRHLTNGRSNAHLATDNRDGYLYREKDMTRTFLQKEQIRHGPLYQHIFKVKFTKRTDTTRTTLTTYI